MAFEPLKRVADRGIPIYLVPGNHERSAIPHRHLGEHPHIHIFDSPRTFRLQKGDYTLALAGFPFIRRNVRQRFLHLIDRTGGREAAADLYLLCIHQAVAGATVGPVGYRFRRAPDVIDPSEIPLGFSAVLAGHIHRHQVLAANPQANGPSVPVLYPGSTDRTSFAEKNENKGFLILEFDLTAQKGSKLRQWQFHRLPVRPMVQLDLHASGMNNHQLRSWIASRLSALPKEAILRLKIHDNVSQKAMEVLSAAALRSLAPPTMNIEAVFVEARRSYRSRR